MESITNTEDMLCNVLILALIVNVLLKEPCAGKPQARFCGGYHNMEI